MFVEWSWLLILNHTRYLFHNPRLIEVFYKIENVLFNNQNVVHGTFDLRLSFQDEPAYPNLPRWLDGFGGHQEGHYCIGLAPKNKPGKNPHIICSAISESWWQTEPFERKLFWEWKNKAQQIVCQG